MIDAQAGADPYRPCRARVNSKENKVKYIAYWAGLLVCVGSTAVASDVPAADQTIVYKTVGDDALKLHIYTPTNHQASDRRPAIVFFHGGGWRGGGFMQFSGQCEFLASRSAIRWVRQHASELGVDPDRLAAGGGSAGGHMAAATAVLDAFNEAGEDTSISCIPNALVLFNPVADNGPGGFGHERVNAYWEEFSPLHNIHEKAPPTLILTGSEDSAFKVSSARQYKQRMEAVGKRCDLRIYEGQPHAFFNRERSEAMYRQTLRDAEAFLASLGYIAAPQATVEAAVQPNILLILADDLGYHDVGFQGSERIRTPHLDQLARMGTRFTDGHVSASVCSPSRAGMMTGRYQQRFGHEANVPPRPHGMDLNERTLGQALKQLGYRTALFGKWHLGEERAQYPTARGFDEFHGIRGGHRTFWFDPDHAHDQPGDPKNVESNGRQVTFDGHFTDWLGDRTVAFVNDCKGQPFFAFLSFTAPHAPLESKPEDLEALGTDDHYLGLIYGLDRNVGKVIDALKRNGQFDNTLIWFLSDNGGTVRQASNHPLGGKKGTKFEGGHRVPFILYWGGRVPAGDYEPMVSALDIYPTSIKAAGGSLDQERPVDGVDLLPYLTGTSTGVPHPWLIWRKLECAAARDGDWKLIRVEQHGFALYNLSTDIGERHDLAGEMPETVEKLRKQLESWETDKMEPLWLEGEKWTGVRFKDHTVKFETGLLPGRKAGSLMLGE
jgi:arylsulfatase A-like enzyme/acetyl esterase/lipase